MSYRTYNNLWSSTQDQLSSILKKDRELQGTFTQEQKSDVLQRLRLVYLGYIGAARKLNTCHDSLIHPQRRLLLRRLLDSTLGRLVEIKHELVALNFSDIQHFDDLMEDLKLDPSDLVIPIPTYIKREKEELIKQRNEFIDECLRKAGLEGISEEAVIPMSIHEAILLLQKHERARQARSKAEHRKEMLARQEREKGRAKLTITKEEAVVRLQAFTRGMLARKRVKVERMEEERPDPSIDRGWKEKLEKVQHSRYQLQEDRKKELIKLEKRVKGKLMYEEGTQMMSAMEDTIREWIFKEKHETGKFPDIPEEEEGGSAVIFGGPRLDETPSEEMAKPTKDSRGGQGGRERSASASKTDREKSRDAKSKKKKEEDDKVVSLKPSAFFDDVSDACDQYQDVWGLKKADDNPEEHPEEEMVIGAQRAMVEAEIRLQVDYLMRQELQRLKEDVEGEKRGSKKKKKVKKGGKKGRKRKEKDLTPDRTTESLFEELVLNGIIKKVPETKLEDVYGSINMIGSQILQKVGYAQAAIGDIKNTLTEYVILPLGIDTVHQEAPLVKSVLLCGPRDSGKSILIQAVCFETGATFMDLTATNIVGRYPGRTGLNMLVHLVMKVGRLLQPTIIFVDAADRTFLKKVPKTDKSDPRRLRKELPKMMKNIAPEDKLLIIGATNSPWNCDVKAMSSVYQKMLFIQRPNYSTRADLWRYFINKHGGTVTSNLDIGALARISDGFMTGQISKVAAQVIRYGQMNESEKKPLRASDFILPLSKLEPLYREEEEAIRTWYMKIPLMKKRTKQLEEELAALELKAKGDKNKTMETQKTKKKKKRRRKKKKQQ